MISDNRQEIMYYLFIITGKVIPQVNIVDRKIRAVFRLCNSYSKMNNLFCGTPAQVDIYWVQLPQSLAVYPCTQHAQIVIVNFLFVLQKTHFWSYKLTIERVLRLQLSWQGSLLNSHAALYSPGNPRKKNQSWTKI